MKKDYAIAKNKKRFAFWQVNDIMYRLQNGFYQLDNRGNYFRFRDKFFERITTQALKSVTRNTTNLTQFNTSYDRVYNMNANNTISKEDVVSLVTLETLILVNNGYIQLNHDGFMIFYDIPTVVTTKQGIRTEKTSVISYLFHMVYNHLKDNKQETHARLYEYDDNNKEVSIFDIGYLKNLCYSDLYPSFRNGIVNKADRQALETIHNSKYSQELNTFIIYRCQGLSLRECADMMECSKKHIETLQKQVNKVYDKFYKPHKTGFDGIYDTTDKMEYITALLCGEISNPQATTTAIVSHDIYNYDTIDNDNITSLDTGYTRDYKRNTKKQATKKQATKKRNKKQILADYERFNAIMKKAYNN